MKSFGEHMSRFSDSRLPLWARPIAATVLASIVALGLGLYIDDNNGPDDTSTEEVTTYAPQKNLTVERSAQIHAVDELDRSIGAILNNPNCAGTNMRSGVLRIIEQGSEPLYLINPLFERRPVGGKNSDFIGAVRGDSQSSGGFRVSFMPYDSSGRITTTSGRTMDFKWLSEFESGSSRQTPSINDGKVEDRVCVADVATASSVGSVAAYDFARKVAFVASDGVVLTTQSGQVLPFGLAVAHSDLDLLMGTAYAEISRVA